MSKDYSWGLVLSGGVAWGIANGGVLSVLEEHDIEPDYVSGSSMGAVIGALYCMGYRTETFVKLLDQLKALKLASMSEKPLEGGLHGGLFRQNLEEFLRPLLHDATIEDCAIPLVIVAGKVLKPIRWQRIVRDDFLDDIESSVEPIVFPKETKLIDAILASSAIPVLFSPYEIDGTEYIDLANFGAIPARALKTRFHPQRVIAVDTAPKHLGIRKFLPKNWQRFLDAGNREIQAERDECELILEPVMPAAYYRFDKAKEMYEAGRTETTKHIKDVLEVIHGVTP